MASSNGISAFINPANSDKLMVFSNTSNNNLALQIRGTSTSASGSGATNFTAEGTNQDGRILNPSSLAAVSNTSLVAVYGIVRSETTNPCGCLNCTGSIRTSQNYGEISLVSPVFQPLGVQSEATYGRIAACSSPDNDIWLYYRSTDSLQKIIEIKVTDNNDSSELSSISDVGDETYLKAYYDSENSQRHVMYQDDAKKIYDYNIDKDDNANTGVTDAIYPTGFAVVYVNKQAYLYYSYLSGSDYVMRRAVRDSNGNWQSATSISAKNLNQATQISVTATEATRTNHVVYKNKDGVIEHVLNKW